MLTPVAIAFRQLEKLDTEAERFVTNSWEQLEGPNGAMAGSRSVAIAAYDGDVLVGVAKGWTAGGVGYLSEVIVGANSRNKGIGRELVRHFEFACSRLRSYRLALRVDEN